MSYWSRKPLISIYISLNKFFFKFIKKNVLILRPLTLNVRPGQAVSHVAVSKKTYIYFSKIRSATVLGVHCASLAMDSTQSSHSRSSGACSDSLRVGYESNFQFVVQTNRTIRKCLDCDRRPSSSQVQNRNFSRFSTNVFSRHLRTFKFGKKPWRYTQHVSVLGVPGAAPKVAVENLKQEPNVLSRDRLQNNRHPVVRDARV